MKLSPHFSLAEFTRSQTATRRHIDNTPPPTSIPVIKDLCHNILEPVRLHFNRPVTISSGYRSPELNRLIGGVPTSQHIWTAEYAAVDFEITGADNEFIFDWVGLHCPYDQLILEFHTPGQPSSGWVHVSYSLTNNRHEAFRIIN
jgi:hypothetical protein